MFAVAERSPRRLPRSALLLLLATTLVVAAIDTRNDRGSTVSVGSVYVDILPNPDGTIDEFDRQHAAGEFAGLAADEPPAVVFDLTGLPFGWEPWIDVLGTPEFIEIKRQECDGDSGWASWRAGTNVTPRGSSNCVVDSSRIRQEASNSAQWARWAPGTTSRNSANLQVNVRDALTADFVPN